MIRRMTQQDALDELKDMLAWEQPPVLEEAQVVRLLLGSSQPDTDGYLPSEESWSSSYELDAAAAEGWRRKAAIVAGDYDFSDGEARLSRSQMLQHCLKMANEYKTKITPGSTMFAFSQTVDIRGELWAAEINEGYEVFRVGWVP